MLVPHMLMSLLRMSLYLSAILFVCEEVNPVFFLYFSFTFLHGQISKISLKLSWRECALCNGVSGQCSTWGRG